MTLAAKLTDKQKWQRLLSSLRYSLYVIFKSQKPSKGWKIT